MVDGIKKELSRVREQKRSAHAALVKVAHDRGFFNPEWGQNSEAWLSDLDFDGADSWEEADRVVDDPAALATAPIRQEAVAWSRWWVKFKEWDLLGQPGTPYPAQLQKLYAKFLALDPDIRGQAKEWGDREFYRKHPGFSHESSLPRFPDELILACWAAED